MSKIRFATGDDEKRGVFWCPGCNMAHAPRIAGKNSWSFNGDVDSPTFDPSILVQWDEGEQSGRVHHQCHSLVRDGKIQFLSDCTHSMASQTVVIPEWPKPDFGGLDSEIFQNTKMGN